MQSTRKNVLCNEQGGICRGDLVFPPTDLSKNFPARERMIPPLHGFGRLTLTYLLTYVAFTRERDELSWLCYFTLLLTDWVSIFFDCFVHT